MSCIFRLCTFMPYKFGPSFSCPAVSCPAYWSFIFTSCNFMPCKCLENWSVNFMSCNFMSCNFMSCNFDGPSFSWPAFSVKNSTPMLNRFRCSFSLQLMCTKTKDDKGDAANVLLMAVLSNASLSWVIALATGAHTQPQSWVREGGVAPAPAMGPWDVSHPWSFFSIFLNGKSCFLADFVFRNAEWGALRGFY